MLLPRHRFLVGIAFFALLSMPLSFSHADAQTEKPSPMPAPMKFGAASVDITCEPGPELAGFLARIQPSTAVYRPIFARAVYLEHGAERLFWLIADSCAFIQEDIARIKKQLSNKYNVEPWRVLVMATHTHSAPSASRLSSCGEYNEEYVETVLLPGGNVSDDTARSNKVVWRATHSRPAVYTVNGVKLVFSPRKARKYTEVNFRVFCG